MPTNIIPAQSTAMLTYVFAFSALTSAIFIIARYIINAITPKLYWKFISCIYTYVVNILIIISGESNIYLVYFFPVVKITVAIGPNIV